MMLCKPNTFLKLNNISTTRKSSSLSLKTRPQFATTFHFPSTSSLFNNVKQHNYCTEKKDDTEEVDYLKYFVLEEKVRENEPINVLRKRLRYQSHQRGMKETCIILGVFADKELPNMDATELKQFEGLVRSPDIDLYNWVFDKEPFPSELNTPVAQKLRDFVQNGGARVAAN